MICSVVVVFKGDICSKPGKMFFFCSPDEFPLEPCFVFFICCICAADIPVSWGFCS